MFTCRKSREIRIERMWTSSLERYFAGWMMSKRKLPNVAFLLLIGVLGFAGNCLAQASGQSSGQSSQQQQGTLGSAAAAVQVPQPPQAGDPSYGGSVPQGTASPTPIPLSMGDAINRGLK